MIFFFFNFSNIMIKIQILEHIRIMSKKLSDDKTILVTGGAGFIGSHLVDALVSRGLKVRVVDDLSRGSLDNLQQCLDKIDFIQGDIADMKIAEDALKGCDYCFHLAAVVGGVSFMNSNPDQIFKSMLINYNMFEADRKMDLSNLLYVSSACTYPVNLQLTESQPSLKEEDVLKCGAMPDSDYGWVKLVGEIQSQAYVRSYGMPIVIVRPFNPYGPRECFNPDHSHVIPALIKRAVQKEDPFKVWGDGLQIRTFTYVTDLVEGLILAMEKALPGDPINISDENYVTIHELVALVLKVTQHSPTVLYDVTKPEGVKSRRCDMSKAYDVLGWFPKICLEEGLRNTLEWYLKSEFSGAMSKA
jgi:nucleoside-diphosphate-sugar epimerase